MLTECSEQFRKKDADWGEKKSIIIIPSTGILLFLLSTFHILSHLILLLTILAIPARPGRQLGETDFLNAMARGQSHKGFVLPVDKVLRTTARSRSGSGLLCVGHY